MSPNALSRQFKSVRRQRSFFVATSMVLLVIVFLLAGTMSQVQRTTVLLPSRVADGMVAAGAVDSRYVEALALDAIYAFYNASPANASYGRRVVERLASVRDRPLLLDNFDTVADDIRQRRISTVFYVEKLELDRDAMTVRAVGSLATFIETKRVSIEPRVVVVSFVEEASSVRLASMNVEAT